MVSPQPRACATYEPERHLRDDFLHFRAHFSYLSHGEIRGSILCAGPNSVGAIHLEHRAKLSCTSSNSAKHAHLSPPSQNEAPPWVEVFVLVFSSLYPTDLTPLKKVIPTSGHRLFLSCLIIAAKYLHDQSMPNKFWAAYSVIFDVSEVNQMERHLLLMLNYDLRFNEFEACMLFAPLMPTATQRVRTEALQRVAKASQTRAMVYAPVTQSQEKPPAPLKGQVVQARPVPQPQTATSTIASAVRGIAKRLSSSHLQRPPSVSVSSMYSVSSNASTTDSEAGSLTDDNGSCSSSSESDLGATGESDLESDQDVPKWNNVVFRPAPACTSRDPRRRKPSNSSVRSSMTIKAHRSPPKRMTDSSDNNKNGYRISSYGSESAGLVSSSTMPSLRSVSTSVTTASGFLSRMWGAAKGHASAVAATQPPPSDGVVVDVVEPTESQSHFLFLHGHRDGALRRLVHSRSAVLRSGGDGSTLDD
jgi:PHO85 cyclin-1